jgi:hypothetical protein
MLRLPATVYRSMFGVPCRRVPEKSQSESCNCRGVSCF